jgi:hypothetical protein
MFYGKDMVTKDFDLLINKLSEQELFLFEPMPNYKTSDRWTDEFRIRDGHTKLADGSWVTIIKVTTWVEKLKKDTEDLYTSYQTNLQEIQLLKQQRREMEYGLRVAEKALKNSLAITKEMINE